MLEVRNEVWTAKIGRGNNNDNSNNTLENKQKEPLITALPVVHMCKCELQNIVRFEIQYLTCASKCLFHAIHTGK